VRAVNMYLKKKWPAVKQEYSVSLIKISIFQNNEIAIWPSWQKAAEE